MLEILHFVFRDFWTFAGVLILICAPLCIIENLIVGATRNLCLTARAKYQTEVNPDDQ